MNPPGQHQEFGTATVKMDRETLEALHEACRDALAPIHIDSVKTMSVTLVAAVSVRWAIPTRRALPTAYPSLWST